MTNEELSKFVRDNVSDSEMLNNILKGFEELEVTDDFVETILSLFKKGEK